MSIVLAILGAAAATTTGVLLERYLRNRDAQPDGPPIPDLPERGLLPAPEQEQPPTAPADGAPPASMEGHLAAAAELAATFPKSPVHGELHKDIRGTWWAFSNVRKKATPASRGWAQVRGA